MAVITCTNCPTTLRIPDGVSGHVKCPKCGHLFPVKALPTSGSSGSVPATANPQPKPTPPAPAPKPAPPVRKASAPPAFEVVDEPEPSRKRARSFDDDDEVERPKKKKKTRQDEEDEDFIPQGDKKGQGKGRVGMLLLTIGSWLYFSMYVLFTLRAFLLLVAIATVDTSGKNWQASGSSSISNARTLASLDEFMMIVLGLLGMGNWVVSLIGFSFSIAGPERSRAPSIIATSISGVQLLLMTLCFVIISNSRSGLMIAGMNLLPLASSPWLIFSSNMIDVSSFVPSLVYYSRTIGGEYLVLVLTGVCEMARLFFTLITIRTMANFGKNNPAAARTQIGIVTTAIILGASLIGSAFLMVLLNEARFSSPTTIATVLYTWIFLVCLAYSVMLIFPALTAASVYQSLKRRIR